MKKTLHLLALLLSLAAPFAQAQLSIEIAGAGANQMPVAIADFGGEPGMARALTTIIRSDLERSGVFRLIPNSLNATEMTTVDLAGVKASGADALAVGSLSPVGGGRFDARYRLYDTARQTTLAMGAYVTTSERLRTAGHKIADDIYEKLTGEKGIFSTRIAYVAKSGDRYQLQVADVDGQNAQAALVSREPIISPVWSPDGGKIAYVSFESKKPIIYVHTIATGRRLVLANFKGSNSAPAWSPDGSRLAIALTRDGNSQLYTLNADGSGLKRLLVSGGIDTEPRYTPDGSFIYFTSDRGGSPQIYRVPSGGGEAQRVTFEGSYNVSPRISPDGKSLAFITRREGRFQLALMDLDTRQVQILTDSRKDESPSFAPNGRMILIATEAGGRNVLSAISIDGRFRQRLSISGGDVREPTWGPYLQ